MTDFKIEKGVPLRPMGRRRGLAEATLRDMEVGDSVVVETTRASTFRDAARKIMVEITTRRESAKTRRVWLISKTRIQNKKQRKFE